ncbi:MAG: protein BatD [Deltaproteobacteria bacterium]|jgi:hypothetical protein|nr:protein BatD [Deltaproteobacteria bacterium]
MKRNSFIFLTTILINLIPALSAANISVVLKLDRSEMILTDSVQLVVSVAGSRDTGSEPVIQGLENFRVNPAGTSSRFEFINGKISSGLDYTYFIQPQKIGTFRIGPAHVQLKGKTYSSNTATLRVVKPAADKGADRDPIFLEAALSNDTVYVEEQTLYTLKLYLRRNVRNISLNLPKVDNLIFKQIAKPVEYSSNVGSQSYQVLEVRYAVVPSKAGRFSVEPAQMSMTVLETRRNSNRGFFDDPFASFSTGRPVTVAGPSLQLTVRPLPENGKPSDFSGLTGKFNMRSKLEPVTLKTGESATLTISVSGTGNIHRIPDLKIPELDHIKIYADKPVLESTQDPAGMKGSKTMKWALVPEKEGRLTVPAIAVSFFDTENDMYKTLKSASYTLSVLPGKKEKISVSESNTTAASNENAGKHAVKELGRDIFPVHSDMQSFKTAKRLQLEVWLFLVLLGLPVMLYLGTLGGMKLRRHSRAGQPDNLAKKAAREFYKQYRKSELTSSKQLRLVREYLNSRFGLSYGSLTPQEAVKILVSQGIGADTAENLHHIMQQLENAEYTGKGNETAIIAQDIAPIIKQIEKQIR